MSISSPAAAWKVIENEGGMSGWTIVAIMLGELLAVDDSAGT